jgi:hypothetical protein
MTKVTLESLAAMIQKEFLAVHQKIENIKIDLHSLDAKLQTQINDLDLKVSAMGSGWQQDFTGHENRIQFLEVDVRALNGRVYSKK